MVEKTFATPLGTIRYWVERRDSKALTLVFLPGLTADHTLFRFQTAYFSGRYSLLTWDAPGHGASRPFALAFSLWDQAAWLRGILEQEGISAFCLVGQSMGGYVAQCFLERYSGLAQGFISIDSAPLKRRYTTAAEIWLLRHCGILYRFYPWKALQRAAAKGCAVTEQGRAQMEQMMAAYSRREYSALAAHGYRLLAEALAGDYPYAISCPALLLCGERDGAASTRRYNRAWAEGEGLPLVWIPGAGHNANVDNPQAVNSRIEAFLQGLTEGAESSCGQKGGEA